MPSQRSLIRTVWRTGVRGCCPECGQTSIFSGYIATHRRCSECDLTYETSPGAWLGAIAIGYGIGALAALLLAFVEVWWGPLRVLGLDPLWTIAVLALIATGVGLRWAKAIWFVLLYHWDFMAIGDARPGPPPAP
jgi:uncharacterized protein (DUF983 family)